LTRWAAPPGVSWSRGVSAWQRGAPRRLGARVCSGRDARSPAPRPLRARTLTPRPAAAPVPPSRPARPRQAVKLMVKVLAKSMDSSLAVDKVELATVTRDEASGKVRGGGGGAGRGGARGGEGRVGLVGWGRWGLAGPRRGLGVQAGVGRGGCDCGLLLLPRRSRPPTPCRRPRAPRPPPKIHFKVFTATELQPLLDAANAEKEQEQT
jgi:hypothetical protein